MPVFVLKDNARVLDVVIGLSMPTSECVIIEHGCAKGDFSFIGRE
jgi:hypothetical protein